MSSGSLGGVNSIEGLFSLFGHTFNPEAANGQLLVLGQGPPTLQTQLRGSAPGEGPPVFEVEVEVEGDTFTDADLREYIIGLDPTELLTLQQGLFSEGYYGTIDDISEIEDPINTGEALKQAAFDAATAFEQGVVTGMEAAPTLEGRFANFTLEDLDAAKDDYLRKEPVSSMTVTPSSAVDRMVENTWKKLLGRKPTAEERRAAFGAVRAAQIAGAEAARQAREQGGIVEQVDVTGILEGRAGTADPMRMAAMSMSESSNLVRSAIGLA